MTGFTALLFLLGSSWLSLSPKASASARPLPKVAVVLASKGVGEVVPPLLQGLRLLEDQLVCSPVALTFDPSTAKRLGKLVGEEFNELVLHPILCVADVINNREVLTARLKNTSCAVLSFQSDAAESSSGVWGLFQGKGSNDRWQTNLAVVVEILRDIGVDNFLVLSGTSSTSVEDPRFSETVRAVKTTGNQVVMVEIPSANGPRPFKLTRWSEGDEIIASTLIDFQR